MPPKTPTTETIVQIATSTPGAAAQLRPFGLKT
jgi:hypothetical protein